MYILGFNDMQLPQVILASSSWIGRECQSNMPDFCLWIVTCLLSEEELRTFHKKTGHNRSLTGVTRFYIGWNFFPNSPEHLYKDPNFAMQEWSISLQVELKIQYRWLQLTRGQERLHLFQRWLTWDFFHHPQVNHCACGVILSPNTVIDGEDGDILVDSSGDLHIYPIGICDQEWSNFLDGSILLVTDIRNINLNLLRLVLLQIYRLRTRIMMSFGSCRRRSCISVGHTTLPFNSADC